MVRRLVVIRSDIRLGGHIKIDHLISKARHGIREAEGVFTDLAGSKDIIALALLISLKDNVSVWTDDFPINIKVATCLNLCRV